MLPCSSSAQAEGCEEESEAHMETEFQIFDLQTSTAVHSKYGKGNNANLRYPRISGDLCALCFCETRSNGLTCCPLPQCNRLTEERDEAQRQLKHIKRVSQMVIEEVGVLQTQLEIEKSCRENAEALATKLNCENRKLKYLSLSSRPCLDELLPSISDCIALEADGDAADSVGNSPDTFSQCQQQVKELRETVNGLLEEKKGFVCQIHEQQRQIEELTTQFEKNQEEMKQLRETVEQQSKTIKRFNRVSMMAAQEYEGMKEQLDLEQDLRVKAETYAHEMLVKQKEANRQSMLLLQSAEPSIQLLKALEDIAAITKTLEEEHLQRQLELLEVEKKEVEGRLEQTEKKNEELEKRVHELQEAQKKITDSTSLPPPEPGFPDRHHEEVIQRLQSKTAEGVDDVKVKAVNEMMERIKHGVVLRPVKSQDSKPPPCEEKQQESAMDELKCILETVKRSPSRGSQESGPSGPSPPVKKDTELEVILRRRRNKAGEAGSGDEREGQMSHVSSSDSLNGRRTSSDSGKDSEGASGLSAPSEAAGIIRVSPDRRGSGPGPAVPPRKRSDLERRSCSSLSEKEMSESQISNGCSSSTDEENQIKLNGVDHEEPGDGDHNEHLQHVNYQPD
ncbi:hypothetical protein CCH79_00012540, partial [Gambusia affinis]